MGEPQKKRKRPRRGFVACPACGAEGRMGLKACPKCGVKLPGAGGFPFWIVAVVVLGIAAIAAGVYLTQKEEPGKVRRPPEERIGPAEEEPAEKTVKKPKEEAEESVLDIFTETGLPEPTMEAPGTEKAKPEEEGTLSE